MAIVALTTCSVAQVSFLGAPIVLGGTVSGLAGSGLVLSNNGGDDLVISSNGPFTFSTPMEDGQSYAVTVKAQPSNPTQMCSVTGGSGTTGARAVDIQVDCRTVGFTVGGTVSGLLGAGLVLQNNAGDNLSISGDGPFTFDSSVVSGAAYEVSVAVQPSSPTQVCSVTRGVGVVADANISDIAVTCVTSGFLVGGTVSGLVGTGLVLQNNGGDDLAITGNGSFGFPTRVPSGATFAVTVAAQPTNPAQTCRVLGGAGTIGGADATSVTINCDTSRFTIAGTINGLLGVVTLQNNGGDDLEVSANGEFAFRTPLASGATYDVTVASDPQSPSQHCTVTGGQGTVRDTDVTSVVVTCQTNAFRVRGTVTGLASGNSLTLRNNSTGETVTTNNSAFRFLTPVLSGQPYDVIVVADPTAPIAQHCSVTNGSGTMGNGDITNVSVTCTTSTFVIRVAVSDLRSGPFVLRNNGGDDLPITSNGASAFTGQIASGAGYNVTVATQPTGSTCTVANGSGTVGASDVTVAVSCAGWSAVGFPILHIPQGNRIGSGDLVFDNNGDLLATASDLDGNSSIIRVDRVTHAITTVAIASDTNWLGVTYRAANDRIYASDTTHIYEITPSGTIRTLTDVSNGLMAITIAPPGFGGFGGFIIGVGRSGAMIAVNPADGAVTTFATNAVGSDLAFAPNGTLYICDQSFSTPSAPVRTVTATGVVTTFAPASGSGDGITIAPDGSRLFIADSAANNIRQITIPGAVMSVVAPADIDEGAAPAGIVFAPGNLLIVMTGENDLSLSAFPL